MPASRISHSARQQVEQEATENQAVGASCIAAPACLEQAATAARRKAMAWPERSGSPGGTRLRPAPRTPTLCKPAKTDPEVQLTYLRIDRIYGAMKTTLILRDDVVRRAKAMAAMRGQPLGRYVEQTLERALQEEEKKPHTVGDWIEALPPVTKTAVRDLRVALSAPDFRPIDTEMWQ